MVRGQGMRDLRGRASGIDHARETVMRDHGARGLGTCMGNQHVKGWTGSNGF